MIAKLRKGLWTLAARAPPACRSAPRMTRRPKRALPVEKDDVNQTNIRMVHLGTMRSDPGLLRLEVMNEVFGGGFSSRLFSNVPLQEGLA